MKTEGAEEAFMGCMPRENCHVSFGKPSPRASARLPLIFGSRVAALPAEQASHVARYVAHVQSQDAGM